MLRRLFRKDSVTIDKSLKKSIINILGIKPKNFLVFYAAINHRSTKDTQNQNNERLEYLGDAVLGTVVAHYLYNRYPMKEEGFLTEMRSKMVNRLYLNEVALKMGINRIALYNKSDNSLKTSGIFGNTLEALIGAVYLDQGYEKTQKWILKNIIFPHMSIETLELLEINQKNKLIGWASRNNKELIFQIEEESIEGTRKIFIMNTVLDGEVFSKGKGYNKKEASQAAATAAIEKLGLI